MKREFKSNNILPLGASEQFDENSVDQFPVSINGTAFQSKSRGPSRSRSEDTLHQTTSEKRLPNLHGKSNSQQKNTGLKSDNLQYNMLGRWNEQLIDQASDVPSIIFFHNFLQNSLQKSFQFIFL